MKRILRVLSLFVLLVAGNTDLMAQAFQGFEDRATDVDCNTTECHYTDPDQTAHELMDFTNANSKFIPVNDINIVNPAGTDRLGFKTFFSPTGTGGGLSEGDIFGFAKGAAITGSFGGVGAFEGSQAFFLEDVDGEVSLVFTPVRIEPGATGNFSMQYIYDGSFDTEATTPNDRMNISLEVTGCAAAGTITLVDVDGTAPPGAEEQWQGLTQSLAPYAGCDVQLVIKVDVNTTSEEVAFDAISFAAGGVLPVELTEFSGRQEKNEVVLNWATAQETENSGFSVERSMDGVSFAEIGWVNGAGDAASGEEYEFKDFGVVSGNGYYYRLRQEDYDGTFAYSELVYVQLTGGELAGNSARFFPNPMANGQSQIELSARSEGDWVVTVFDAAGRLVKERKHRLVAGPNTVAIDLSEQKDGAYLVRVSGPDETIVRRVVR